MQLTDLRPVRDPALREAYRQQGERFIQEAEKLKQQHHHTEAREMKRHGRYLQLVASGVVPREAEDMTAAQMKVKRTKERLTAPEDLLKLPLRALLAELDGSPDDPLPVIMAVRAMPEFVEITSRFTQQEWLVLVLRDGYGQHSWQVSEWLKCSVRAVEKAYAKARSKFTLAMDDYANLCR